MDTPNQKDLEMYKKVIKSQYGNNSEICEVVKLMVDDLIFTKPLHKQVIWYIKSEDKTYRQAHEIEIRKYVFPKLVTMYHQTADFLYRHAFNEGQLIKYHYIDIAYKLIMVSKLLNRNGFKNTLMKELAFVLCNI